jgi:Tfp pilus assembly protein PilF
MEAERLFRIAARMGTRAERAIALSNLGLISFNRSETDSARHHWVRAKELEPNSPTLLYNLGVLASREEDYAAAAEQFRLALDVDPMNTDVMRSLAFARARHGEGLDEAEELARKASKRDPSFESRRVLGYVLAKHEKFDEAAALLKDLVREQPGNMWVTLHLARAEIGRGNSSEAQRLLSRVVDGSTDRDMTEEARSLLQSL